MEFADHLVWQQTPWTYNTQLFCSKLVLMIR